MNTVVAANELESSAGVRADDASLQQLDGIEVVPLQHAASSEEPAKHTIVTTASGGKPHLFRALIGTSTLPGKGARTETERNKHSAICIHVHVQ